MPQSLLDSQFADLEVPAPEEKALVIDIDQTTAAQVDQIIAGLGLSAAPPP
jgi:gluconokinase